jgi:hypothetical protein
MAITTRKETKNENNRYGMERITAARNAFDISSDGVGIELGREDWMMVKSVTTVCSVLSVSGGTSGRGLYHHRQIAGRPKIRNGRNNLSQQKDEKSRHKSIESITHRRVVSSSRQVAHHTETTSQLDCQFGPDHVSIWMAFLATDMHGASFNNATVSVGGTELRKSMRCMVSDGIEERDRQSVSHDNDLCTERAASGTAPSSFRSVLARLWTRPRCQQSFTAIRRVAHPRTGRALPTIAMGHFPLHPHRRPRLCV